jgi:hypothetical protein
MRAGGQRIGFLRLDLYYQPQSNLLLLVVHPSQLNGHKRHTPAQLALPFRQDLLDSCISSQYKNSYVVWQIIHLHIILYRVGNE